MVIDNKLLKEFAQITNDSEVKTENPYLRGTIVSNTDGKYVQLDGSTTITPISELVNVEEGDRVLVSIENHKATIIGNFTFPPSARKEQEALDQAGSAQESANNANNTANVAQEKAQEASNKADTAISQSSVASASADEAKQQAQDAIATANTASTNASEAKTLATQASTEATEAKQQAAQSQASSADAQAQVAELQNEVKDAQEDIGNALTDLASQSNEITAIKTTYATKVEVGDTKAELETTITEKVGELSTTVSQTYSTKTENVELEGRLQSQITQNAEGLASQVSKTEKLESDTSKAQEDVAEALRQAAAAQTSANNAQSTADAAQTAANNAQTSANEAASKATTAQNAAALAQAAADAADEKVQSAQSDLNEAKQNLESVTSRVDATEADIAEAQTKVDAAQTAVNNALADAAEANLAATKAQEAADKAQQDAETAQGAANTAQQKADNAQTAADNAQSAADKAQADVAALTSRVSTAETTISQNSEQIELNANKITEIGEQADDTDANLANNYYTKTETDASIQIESERITSTVSRVETVENDMNSMASNTDLSEATVGLNTRIDQAETTIEQLSSMISHLVTDGNGESLMTQTADGWTFNMSSINGNLEAIKNAMLEMENDQNNSNDALTKLTNLVNDVANKTAYITISTDDNNDPCIELGKTDSLFKVRITNTAIDFLEGSTRIAYANNNTFYSEKIIANEVQIGEGPAFSWRTRASGNCGLTYVPFEGELDRDLWSQFIKITSYNNAPVLNNNPILTFNGITTPGELYNKYFSLFDEVGTVYADGSNITYSSITLLPRQTINVTVAAKCRNIEYLGICIFGDNESKTRSMHAIPSSYNNTGAEYPLSISYSNSSAENTMNINGIGLMFDTINTTEYNIELIIKEITIS